MAFIPWSIVCDDGSRAQGVLSYITINLLTMTVSGIQVEPEIEAVELIDEAVRVHFPKFIDRPVTIRFDVDSATQKLIGREIELSTDFSEAEEKRIKESMLELLVTLTTIDELLEFIDCSQ